MTIYEALRLANHELRNNGDVGKAKACDLLHSSVLRLAEGATCEDQLLKDIQDIPEPEEKIES